MKESEARRAVSSARVGPGTTLEELMKEALAIRNGGGKATHAA